jgi:hypothetical protein
MNKWDSIDLYLANYNRFYDFIVWTNAAEKAYFGISFIMDSILALSRPNAMRN